MRDLIHWNEKLDARIDRGSLKEKKRTGTMKIACCKQSYK